MKKALHYVVFIGLVTSLLAGFSVPGQGASSDTASPSPYHKAVAPPELLASVQDAVMLHDYGSFALYRISKDALARLAPDARAQVTLVDEYDQIALDAYPFNTQTDTLDLPAHLRVDSPTGDALHLIQFIGPLDDVWLDAIRDAGVVPIQYIAHNAYLVWAGDAGRDRLDALTAAGDFVQYSAPYHPYFKLDKRLRDRVESAADQDSVARILVQIYNHADKATSVQAIHALTVEQFSEWTPILSFENAVIGVRVRDLAAIAQLPDVVWLQQDLDRQLYDEVQDQIVAGNLDAGQDGPSAPGYLAWLAGYGFSQDQADYPVVDVCDDGVGDGSLGTGDPTLHVLGDISNATRMSYVTDCTGSGGAWGLGGHGHINTSIVGGYDARTGTPYKDADGYNRGLGVSPFTRLGHTRIFGDSGSYSVTGCGGTDTSLIRRIQDSGAQISSNSWGAGCRTAYGCTYCPITTYDATDQAYDVGVRDADQTETGNQQLIFIFSAGNDGTCGSGTIGHPGSAKNVIAVGAAENDRPTWTDGCSVAASGADSAMDVINFSSRGPASGGRTKPEVIAPGTHIQGTASTYSGYDGSGVCDQYQPTGQTIFASSSGTSHSAPAVSGIASLLYYWLQNTYSLTPSPAMMKAYMLAHPTYLTGVSANDTLPSNNQGYGMPTLDLAFDTTARVLVDQTQIFGATGQTWTWTGSVADPTKPVRLVIAYTDAAGASGTSNPEVNNLNLEAVIGGSTYLGNVFSGQWSATGGTAEADDNYEAIFLPAGTSGAINITVSAAAINGDGVRNNADTTDQDFALVCYNCTTFPDFSIDATPASIDVCTPNNAQYTVNVSQILGFANPVTLSTTGRPAGTTEAWTVNPVTPPGSSVLTIGNTTGATAGTYTINVVGTAGTLTHQDSVVLNIYSGAPTAAVLTAPADGVTGVVLAPTFTWTDAAEETGYTLEIATDPGFGTIVHSASLAADTTSYSGATLASNTLYYWRVRAANTCGSSTSAVFSFRTALIVCLTYPSSDVPQPINSTAWAESTVAVPDVMSVTDVDVIVGQITHTFDGDLDIYIQHPDLTQVELSTDNGGGDNNYSNTRFDDEAATSITAGTAPFSGSFRPEGSLAALDGKLTQGTWRLLVYDDASGDTGTLSAWSLVVCGTTDFTLDVTPASLDVCKPDNAVYNAAVGVVGDFADPVTLSTTGLPAGTTESWTVNPVTPPGSSTLTIGGTGAVATGAYTIDVTGTSGSTTHSDQFMLRVFDTLLAGPTLTAPADGATGVALTPTFTWADLAGEAGYTIEIATDPGFGTVVHSASLATDTTSYNGATLSSATIYYWRVRATSPCGSQDSATRAFVTSAMSCLTYTSTEVPRDIPDPGTVTSNLMVADTFNATDVNVTIGRIDHGWDADLDIYIVHPDATQAELSTDNGNGGDNYVNTVFDDQAATAISSGSAPFTGSYRPEGVLSALNNLPVNGTWQLRVTDDEAYVAGTLQSWSLTLCGAPGLATADYSDLAGSYGVAWHAGDGALRLGATWTADTSPLPGADDSDDGVAFVTWEPGQSNVVQVDVQGTAVNGRWLRLWFDWDQDGVFDDDGGERVYNAPVSDGVNDIPVPVPADLTQPVNYRARLYDSGSEPTGLLALDPGSMGGAASGEVEDNLKAAPTAVALARLEAWPLGGGIRVEWETTTDLEHMGFDLYRATTPNGEYTRLNGALIPAVAPGSPAGAIYSWTDGQVVPGQEYHYRLEAVNLGGVATNYGRVSARAVYGVYVPVIAR